MPGISAFAKGVSILRFKLILYRLSGVTIRRTAVAETLRVSIPR